MSPKIPSITSPATDWPSLNVLYEDNHLLVIDKPVGLATMGAESGVATIHSWACDYLREKYDKPGRVFVGIVSRLDSMTSGVLCLARTSKAASRLTPQFAEKSGGGAVKIYLAAVEGNWESDVGTLVDWVRKDDQAKRMRVVGADAKGALEASLRYQVVHRTDQSTLLAVRLISGRKHQIRVQFAAAGHPVLGDRKYDSHRAFGRHDSDAAGGKGGMLGVALHSWRLQIEHPTRREKFWFVAGLPDFWEAEIRNLPIGRSGLMNDVWNRVRGGLDVDDDEA